MARVLRAATLTVRDVAATSARYTEWFDYHVAESGTVSAALAASWGCPGNADRRFRTLQPSSSSPVFLRLVEGDLPHEYRPLTTFGWSAIEICVSNVLQVQDRMRRSPFEIIGPAEKSPALPTIFPMQVRGPDDEIVYLTEILSDLAQYDLPRAACLIDHPFILVMGCSDIAATATWFEVNLGLGAGRVIDMHQPLLAQSFGVPPDRIYRLRTLTHGRDVFLELDQYPPQAKARVAPAGQLPPGIALATILCNNFSRVSAPWITPPVRRDGPIYDGARAGTVVAPDGTLVEIVETP